MFLVLVLLPLPGLLGSLNEVNSEMVLRSLFAGGWLQIRRKC
uniref:Uncharacterized protein n=1 Tax=Arundo donax TaxID=35708 RepID=A0A0A8ZV95_ARUDO